jgi:uncharacterized RDD family membrane protein YckC
VSSVPVTSGGIVTPEAVVLELDTAGLGSRLLAALVDGLLSMTALGVIAVVTTPLTLSSPDAASVIVLAAFFLVILVLPIPVQLVMRGRTPGKAVLGLRAVTLDGAPIRLSHAVLRTAGGFVDRFVPPGGITGILFVLGTARSQSVGDLLAGTIVIRDPERHLVPRAVWFPVPPGLDGLAASIDPTAIDDRQYTVVRAFLLRAPTLSPEARHVLATDLADRVAARVGHTRPAPVHPEAYLLCAMARYQRRAFPAYQPGGPR